MDVSSGLRQLLECFRLGVEIFRQYCCM
jgi:hypothetical protein